MCRRARNEHLRVQKNARAGRPTDHRGSAFAAKRDSEFEQCRNEVIIIQRRPASRRQRRSAQRNAKNTDLRDSWRALIPCWTFLLNCVFFSRFINDVSNFIMSFRVT
jgi:hypothetical protein